MSYVWSPPGAAADRDIAIWEIFTRSTDFPAGRRSAEVARGVSSVVSVLWEKPRHGWEVVAFLERFAGAGIFEP
jgi:hypothetical protein